MQLNNLRHIDNPDVQALVDELGSRASVGSALEAIAFGDVVVFAILGSAMDETIQAHAEVLNGKIAIDAANKMNGDEMNSVRAFQTHTPQTKVFRAFNNMGWENFENPTFGDLQADLFYCGEDGQARPVVEGLIRDVGLNPVSVGGLDQVHLVDMVTRLWFALVRGQNLGRELAFKVLRRE